MSPFPPPPPLQPPPPRWLLKGLLISGLSHPLPPSSPKASWQGFAVTLHLPRVSAGKVPGGPAFLSFFFPFFCFKDKIQKSLLHTGCRVHLQMCLQIGAKKFEYLCSWKSACKIGPQSLLNSAKSLSFEGFVMESKWGPRHLSTKAFISKDAYSWNYRVAYSASARCISKGGRAGGICFRRAVKMLAACQTQTGNRLRCLKHMSRACTRACLCHFIALSAGRHERGEACFKVSGGATWARSGK